MRIWTFQVSGSAKCVVLLGVGQPGKDAFSVMLLVTRFPTTSAMGPFGTGRPSVTQFWSVLLVALALDIFHPEFWYWKCAPSRGRSWAPALVEMRPIKRPKQVNCCKP